MKIWEFRTGFSEHSFWLSPWRFAKLGNRFEMLRVSIRLDVSSYNEIKSEMQESGHITEISCHDYFMQNRIQTHQNQSQRQSMKSLLLSKPAPRLWPRLLRRKPGNQPDGLLLYTWGASIDVHGGWSDPETSRMDPQKRDEWEALRRKYEKIRKEETSMKLRQWQQKPK